jgi:NitT/TauT family transport system substrate-binding protein
VTQDITRRRFLALSAAGVALAACSSEAPRVTSATSAAGSSTSVAAKDFGGRTVTMAIYAKNHASSPLYWQQFAPPGLKVEPKIFTSAGDISRALANGELDFGLMGVYNTLIEATSPAGMRSRIIGMVSRQGIGLIGSKAKGIATIADLKGKKVAVPPPGVQTLTLTSALGTVGLTLDKDVTAVPLGYADHPGALERGDIDAYVGTEPLCTKSVVAGLGVRLSEVYKTPVGDLNTALWSSPKNIGDADLLRAVTKMQRDAAELLTPKGVNSEAEWKKLLVDQFGYDEPTYKGALENIGAVWRFDDVRKAQLVGAGELMLKQGVIQTAPKVDELLLLDFQPAS